MSHIEQKHLRIFTFLVLCTQIASSALQQSHINLTEYYSIPPQYSGDDYIRCMIEGDDALWCTSYNIIKPNRSNSIWNTIEKYSKDKKHYFRHDLVQAGVCIKWCQKKLEKLDNATIQSLFEPAFDFGDHYKIDDTLFYKSQEYKLKYDFMINVCRNLYFKENYELRAHSGIVYCYSAIEDKSPDSLDISFVGVLLFLVFLLVAAAVAEIIIEQRSEETETPNHKNPGILWRLLLSFSISRNWKRLNATSSSETPRDLRYIQGLRFSTMFLVVYGHASITYGFSPVTNTEFIEGQYQGIMNLIVQNGMNVVQTFFAISGFLLGVQFNHLSSKRPFSASYFWFAIFYRFLRLTPVYAFIIFFEATWQYKLNDGPFWKTIAETEKTYCRRNWWTNIAYVNNYVNSSQMCLTQSWYLAADFQLFVLALFILMVIWKYPKSKVPLMSLCLVVSYIIPAVITYIRGYDGTFTLSPHDKKFIFQPLAQGFLDYYIPAHTNMGNYFAGLVMSMMYVEYKQRKVNIGDSKIFKVLFYLVVPLGGLTLMSAYPFYAYEIKKPAIWIAVYASLSKNMWGVLGAVFMFGLIGKLGGVLRRFFYYPAFTPLGRITYCIYLVHLIVFRFLTGDIVALPSVSDAQILLLASAGFVLSTLLGLILCLTLEFPFTAILKELTNFETKEKPPTKSTELNTRI